MRMIKLGQAIHLAAKYHSGQYRDSGEPYICHLMRVMQTCLDTFDNSLWIGWTKEEVAIVAVLHDTLEDTLLRYQTIAINIGIKIAGMVDTLSRKKGETYQEFIDRISKDEIASFIKLADLKDNMRDAGSLPEEKKGIIERYKKAYKQLTET